MKKIIFSTIMLYCVFMICSCNQVNSQEIIIKTMNANLSGNLEGKGKEIYEASYNNNYDPFIQCAIIMTETANCTSMSLTKLNNVAGLLNGKELKKYQNVDDSITDLSNILGYIVIADKRNIFNAENIISLYTDYHHSMPLEESNKYAHTVMLNYKKLIDYASKLKISD